MPTKTREGTLQLIQLTEDIKHHEKKLEGFITGEENLKLEATIRQKIDDEKKSYIRNCELRVRAAESINYKNLKNIVIEERKSAANEVFKWIVVAIYIEAECKYYWPNFKVCSPLFRTRSSGKPRPLRTLRRDWEKLTPSTRRRSRKSRQPSS